MAKDKITTIRVHESTVKKIMLMGRMGDTVEEVILKYFPIAKAKELSKSAKTKKQSTKV